MNWPVVLISYEVAGSDFFYDFLKIITSQFL
jgi:hypothetical protein